MAVDMFLKIEGIDGESSDHAHEGDMDVLSFNWDVKQSGTMHVARGGGAGKANVGHLFVKKYVDKASPNLLLACCSGEQFDEAKLTCRKAGGDEQVEYLVIEMENVIIVEVNSGGTKEDDLQDETVALNFAKFKVTYTPQDNDGSPLPEVGPVGWNIQKNEEV